MADCSSNIPESETDAVLLHFYANSAGGTEGSDCPVSCSNPIAEQYYQIADEVNECKYWPGNSGENAMKNGVCGEDGISFEYDQWLDCECAGDPANSKVAYTTKCVVDSPPSLCVQMISNTECLKTTSEPSSTAPSCDGMCCEPEQTGYVFSSGG